MGICINKDIQDVNKITIRKEENLVIDQRVIKEDKPVVKTFYTDGSGMDTGQDILNTGWAWIETKWDIIAKKQHKIGSGGHMAPHLNSVQWCEARAILDIIQNM